MIREQVYTITETAKLLGQGNGSKSPKFLLPSKRIVADYAKNRSHSL